MKIDKKIVNWMLVVVVMVALVISLSVNWFDKREAKILQVKMLEEKESLTKMGGTVVEIKKDSVVVKGTILTSDLNKRISDKKVEFIITPETVFNKTTIRIPIEENSTSSPSISQELGSISDFKLGMFIKNIQGTDDLSSIEKTNLKTVQYDDIIKF